MTTTSQLALREIQRRLSLLRAINDQQARRIVELEQELVTLRAQHPGSGSSDPAQLIADLQAASDPLLGQLEAANADGA